MFADDAANQKQKTKRIRTTFSEEQLQVLQANFQMESNPDGQDLERIAQITGLSKRVTQVWFQNSRARQKKHQTSPPGGGGGPVATGQQIGGNGAKELNNMNNVNTMNAMNINVNMSMSLSNSLSSLNSYSRSPSEAGGEYLTECCSGGVESPHGVTHPVSPQVIHPQGNAPHMATSTIDNHGHNSGHVEIRDMLPSQTAAQQQHQQQQQHMGGYSSSFMEHSGNSLTLMPLV